MFYKIGFYRYKAYGKYKNDTEAILKSDQLNFQT